MQLTVRCYAVKVLVEILNQSLAITLHSALARGSFERIEKSVFRVDKGEKRDRRSPEK